MRNRRLSCTFLLLLLLVAPAYAAEVSVTRGEFIVLLWSSQGGIPFDKTAHPFTDLSRDDEAQAAAWAWSEGLIQGIGGNLFAPDRLLTREECATILRRLDARRGLDPFLPEGTSLCNDYEGVNLWAGDDLYWACITSRMLWMENQLAPHGLVPYWEATGYLFP